VITSIPTLVLALTAFGPHGAPWAGMSFPLLYIGPDQVLPLTSFVGAAIGVLLMFWNRVVGVFRRVLKFSSRK
jgi:hypothetical protein